MLYLSYIFLILQANVSRVRYASWTFSLIRIVQFMAQKRCQNKSNQEWIFLPFLRTNFSDFSEHHLSLLQCLFLSESEMIFSTTSILSAQIHSVWGQFHQYILLEAILREDPKNANKTDGFIVFLSFWDIRALKLFVKCWWNWHLEKGISQFDH